MPYFVLPMCWWVNGLGSAASCEYTTPNQHPGFQFSSLVVLWEGRLDVIYKLPNILAVAAETQEEIAPTKPTTKPQQLRGLRTIAWKMLSLQKLQNHFTV